MLRHLHFVRRGNRQYYWIGCGTFSEWFERQDVDTRDASAVANVIRVQ